MKSVTSLLALIALSIGVACSPSQVAAQETITAKDLASRLSAGVNDGVSFIRLRMEVGGTNLQLQSKNRRTKEGADVLYQVLFPKEKKGEAVLLQRRGSKAPSGKSFSPTGGVQAIGSMKDQAFGTDLSYGDLIENFFAWEGQTFAGNEEVGKTSCTILESKPGGGDSSTYTRVRSWIDLRRMVPMRVEKYSGATLVRRIETTRVAKDDIDRWVAASLLVKRGGQGSGTDIDGSNSKHDVVLSDKDFTAEGMQSLAPPSSK